jgi:hypothetical protein
MLLVQYHLVVSQLVCVCRSRPSLKYMSRNEMRLVKLLVFLRWL